MAAIPHDAWDGRDHDQCMICNAAPEPLPDRMWPDRNARFLDQIREVAAQQEYQPVFVDDGPYSVAKYGSQLPVSDELLTDHDLSVIGYYPDRPLPVFPPATRWQRMRYQVRARVERARVKLASMIVGYDIEDHD